MVYHRTLRQALDALSDGGLHCLTAGPDTDEPMTVEVLATRLPDDVLPHLTRNHSPACPYWPLHDWLSVSGDERLAILADATPAAGCEGDFAADLSFLEGEIAADRSCLRGEPCAVTA